MNGRSILCPGCGQTHQFDYAQAHARLLEKFNALGSLLVSYMDEAPLDRAQRNDRALNKALVAERIIGGTLVSKGEYPDCCLVGQKHANDTIQWTCSGVLIHPQIVLTAGHCHQPPQVMASVVALSCEDMNKLGEAEVISAKISVANPKYAQTGYNDITVIVLKTPAKTPPVPIATRDELINSDQLILVGFGNNDPASTKGFGLKRSVRAHIIGLKRNPSEDLSQLEHRYGFESDIELLAGGHGFDSCNGDSGGPGFITASGTIKVAALTSRGFTRGFSGVPRPCGDGGIYTRIDVERDFIAQVASDYGISILT